jgi:hypothetical protein
MALREQGATLQLLKATADVALTRNNQAGLAVKMLESNPELDWVLWVDSDMSSSIDSVRLMMTVAVSLAQVDSYVPNVSGSYVNRHDVAGVSRMAAFAVRGAETSTVVLETTRADLPSELSVVPALTGMGCLLQHRNSFLAHCLESEWFVYPAPPNIVPCVCQPHVAHASELGQYLEMKPNDENLYWVAEDFDYCQREFDMGRVVYVAPIAFGHDNTVRLVPDNSTVFPGLRPLIPVVE